MDVSLSELRELVLDMEAWCDSWGRKESDMTERLNWAELKGESGGGWQLWLYKDPCRIFVVEIFLYLNCSDGPRNLYMW